MAKPTTPSVSAPSQVTTGDAAKRPLPISSPSRDLEAQLTAKRTKRTVEEVRGVRSYSLPAVKLSEVFVKYVRKWLETPACAKASNNACPTLDQLLAPPDTVAIRLIVGWNRETNMPREEDFIAKKVLASRMDDVYSHLMNMVDGDTKVKFTPFVPLLDRDKNPAAKAVVDGFRNLHKCKPGLTPIQVEPDLTGESESELLKRREAQAAKKQLPQG